MISSTWKSTKARALPRSPRGRPTSGAPGSHARGGPDLRHVKGNVTVLGELREGGDDVPRRVVARHELAEPLQRAELDPGDGGLVPEAESLPGVAVPPASSEEGFDHHESRELPGSPRVLDPPGQCRLEQLSTTTLEVGPPHDPARRLVAGREVLDPQRAGIVLGVRVRAGPDEPAAAHLVDRAIAADAEEVLLEGEALVEVRDPAHGPEEHLLDDIVPRLHVGERAT